jgi:flagellin-like protein
MKSFRRSRKALSPVVASIILIAVTVAISIAVAVWMGALSVGFEGTEQLVITSATVTSGSSCSAVIGVSNTGASSVTISQIWVGNTQITAGVTCTGMSSGNTLAANSQGTVTIPTTATPIQNFISGYSYTLKLISAKGNSYPYIAVAQ